MARRNAQPEADREVILECLHQSCLNCGGRLWNKYDNYRTIRTLEGVVRLRLKVRRCPNLNCERYHQVYRPEQESQWALPQHEFGLDVIAWAGAVRYQEHRSVSEIHTLLEQSGLSISLRSIGHLLERYDELVTTSLSDNPQQQARLEQQQQVILAIDGMQPDVGHEVLWVIRECLSGEILLARTCLSATHETLAELLYTVEQRLTVPIIAVVSDGQHSIRKAVERALPDAVHGLCHFHYLREATKPIYEADRHAKKELKKRVRGVRKIEQAVCDANDATSEIVQDYCQAVRSALTGSSHPPLDASGLKLQQQLSAVDQSIARIEKKGRSLSRL